MFKQTEKHFRITLKDETPDTIEKMISSLRNAEKEFNSSIHISGMELLAQLLQDGSVTMELFIQILPLIKDTKAEYIIK